MVEWGAWITLPTKNNALLLKDNSLGTQRWPKANNKLRSINLRKCGTLVKTKGIWQISHVIWNLCIGWRKQQTGKPARNITEGSEEQDRQSGLSQIPEVCKTVYLHRPAHMLWRHQTGPHLSQDEYEVLHTKEIKAWANL